jgi:hypothetical protein
MTICIYGKQINWFHQFWIDGINGHNVATCPYLARHTWIQRVMLKMKQDPYVLYEDAGFIFPIVDICYITISALVPAFHCKLESRKQ